MMASRSRSRSGVASLRNSETSFLTSSLNDDVNEPKTNKAASPRVLKGRERKATALNSVLTSGPSSQTQTSSRAASAKSRRSRSSPTSKQETSQSTKSSRKRSRSNSGTLDEAACVERGELSSTEQYSVTDVKRTRYNLRSQSRKLESNSSGARSTSSSSSSSTAASAKRSVSDSRAPTSRISQSGSAANQSGTSKQSASQRPLPTAATGACASLRGSGSSSNSASVSTRRAGAAQSQAAPTTASATSSRLAVAASRRSGKHTASAATASTPASGHDLANTTVLPNASRMSNGGRNGNANANANTAPPTSDSTAAATPAAPAPSTSASNATSSALSTVLSGLPAALLADQQNELTRLYELIEQRGLPQPLRDALGPRVTQLVQRTMAASGGKTSAYLTALQSEDESQQLTALIELNQYLLMGNEETLAGFPIRQFVPVLVRLIRSEHSNNLELCMSACRSLCYLMESLPRSSALMVDTIPPLLEKLQVIEYMDVTEQALKALEMLSKRNGRQIRQAGGIRACLEFIDFLSIDSQRSALHVTANCCQHMQPDEFEYIRPSLAVLVQRLATQDRRSVEYVCSCFARLVDSYREQPTVLAELANGDLIKNVQALLAVSPPLISASTFVTLLRMLVVMCACCAQMSAVLLRHNFGETLCFLLVGTSAHADAVRSFEFITRSPQELYEMLSLAAEMLPKLPTDGLFAVDAVLNDYLAQRSSSSAIWHWQADDGRWVPYSEHDSRLIEQARLDGENEFPLRIGGRVYILQLQSMVQRNAHTQSSRAIQRRVATPSTSTTTVPNPDKAPESDSATALNLGVKTEMANALVRTLFPILLHVYTSCSGASVRNRCVQAQLRMLYYADSSILEQTLRDQPVAAHIAAMLSTTSSDLRALVAGLQIAETLMRKLPHIFSAVFRRHGVVHRIERLARKWQKLAQAQSAQQTSSTPSEPAPTVEQSAHSSLPDASGLESESISTSAVTKSPGNSDPSKRKRDDEAATTSESAAALGSRRSRAGLSAYTPYRMPTTSRTARTESEAASTASEQPGDQTAQRNTTARLTPHTFSSLMAGSRAAPQSPGAPGSTSTSAPSSTAMALFSLSRLRHAALAQPSTSNSPKRTDTTAKREDKSKVQSGRVQLKLWIRDCAQRFLDRHAAELKQSSAVAESLEQLEQLLNDLSSPNPPASDAERTALRSLVVLLIQADMTAFELEHASFAKRLVAFLIGSRDKNADHTPTTMRTDRLRNLLIAFRKPLADGREPLRMLVAKLIEIVQYREQFPVRLNETSAAGSAAAAAGLSAFADGLPGELHSFGFGARQLRLQLVRHPGCASSSVAQFRHGAVRVDPLAPVATVERFLLARNLVVEREPVAKPKDKQRGARAPWLRGSTSDDTSASATKKRDSKAKKQEAKRAQRAAGRKAAKKSAKREEDSDAAMDISMRSATRDDDDDDAADFADADDQDHVDDDDDDPDDLGGATMMDWFAEDDDDDDDDDDDGELITDDDDDDDFSDDYDDEAAAYFHDSGARGSSRRIELLMGERPLPSHISVFEAVTQFTTDRGGDASSRRARQLSGATNASTTDDSDTDSENPYSLASDVWTRTHTLYYRPLSSQPSGKKDKTQTQTLTQTQTGSPSTCAAASSSNADASVSGSSASTSANSTPHGRSGSKKSSPRDVAAKHAAGRKLFSLFDSAAGKHALPSELLGGGKSPLLNFCESAWSLGLPASSDVHADPSAHVLALLRVLHAVERFWYSLFAADGARFEEDPAVAPLFPLSSPNRATPLLSASEFFSTKLIAKVNRQLQEPVLILTSTLPRWIPDVAAACPFLFPFETRAVLFFIETFDRDRALLRLTDSINVLLSSAASASSMSLGSRLTNGDNSAPSAAPGATAADTIRSSTSLLRPNTANSGAPNTANSSAASRLDRRRKTVRREDLFKQADKILNEVGGSGALLEIQYENESGTGLGPTLEFYALVSREFQKVSLDMWRNTNARHVSRKPVSDDDVTTEKESDEQLVFAPNGLYPAPIASSCKLATLNKLKQRFRFLGRFMARALMDSRVLDLPLNVCMYKWLLGEQDTLCGEDLQHIDPDLYRQFSRLHRALLRRAADGQVLIDGATVDDLCLDFTLPGYPHIELAKNGRLQPVTADNLGQYLHAVVQYTLVEGVRRQMEALLEGFTAVVQTRSLRLLFAEELEALFCGSRNEPWDLRTLMETCRTDHGYNMDSRAIKWLFEIMCSFNADEQRTFLHFVTGSPRLPIGGFRALNPPLTIVRRTVEPNEPAAAAAAAANNAANAGTPSGASAAVSANVATDQQLPSVMTCVNYLKLPDYSSQEIMRRKLKQAVYEGKNYFLLS